MEDKMEMFDKYSKYEAQYDRLALRQMTANITVVINSILGVIVWGLMIGLTLVVAVDIVYMTIPFIRSKVDSAGLNRRRFGKFRLVSYDAEKAIEMAQLNGEASPLRQYLLLRMKTNIFVACMLTILICGGWEWITNFLTPIIVSIVTSFIQF